MKSPATITKAVALGVLLLIAQGCSSSGFGGLSGAAGSSQGDEDDDDAPAGTTLENRHPEDTGKPTEDSEGVPGYLTDPKLIAVLEKADGVLEITGQPGAVAAAVVDGVALGDPDQVTLKALEADAKELVKLADKNPLEVAVKELGEITVAKDGSFKAAFEGVEKELVFVVAKPLDKENVLDLTDIAKDAPFAMIADLVRGGGFRVPDPKLISAGEGLGRFCAIGKLEGETEERLAMMNFEGHQDFVCGECSKDPLPDDHPLAGTLQDARPCRLLPAGDAPKEEEAPGFFVSNKTCSHINTKCRLQDDQPFLFSDDQELYEFKPAKSYREATLEAAKTCKNFFGSSITDILMPSAPTGTACDGIHVPLRHEDKELVGCLMPPEQTSALQASACTVNKVLGGNDDSGTPCDVYLEPVASCD